MDEAEFDKFADEYKELHRGVIKASGESDEFFAEYKIQDVAKIIQEKGYPDDLNVLDFGAGVGNSVPYFLKYLPKSQLVCLDVSRKSLEIGSAKYKNAAEFVHFDGRHIPKPDNTYHLVFTACVFHHIPHDLHGLLAKEILRILKPGGIFIVFEHNPFNPLTVKAVNDCPFDENAVLIRGRDMYNLLTTSGFVCDKPCYRIFFPGQLRVFRPLEKFLKWLPIGAQYYVSAQKLT